MAAVVLDAECDTETLSTLYNVAKLAAQWSGACPSWRMMSDRTNWNGKLNMN